MSTYQPGSEQGLPEAAVRRLKQMRGTGTSPTLFTSDLSINEFLLVKQAGFDPVGLVMGSSIYHIGFQMAGQYQNMEMDILTQAMYHARELAMDRMEEEADILGADGVVGVRLIVNQQQWGENLAEFMAIGTAIKSRNGENWRTPDNRPFTSDLSGQQFWTLLQTGYRPVALAMGTCVYHVAHQGFMQMLKRIGRNVEMENYTQAIYDARELAMSRMQAEAERAGATGIVGTRVVEASHGWGSHVIEFFSVGTAVREHHVDHVPAAPSTVLPLVDF
jgi:uncharacterized protein YbjQ (UPF0145 family)